MNRSTHLFCAFALTLLLALPASGQLSFGAKAGRKTTARLALSHEVARPGDTITAAVELTMDPGWHTYWKNSGDSGDATKIHWNLPADLQAGEIQWPVPEKYVASDVTTYVFHERAVLLVPLQIPANATAGEHELKALVKWLECEKVCVPGSNLVSAKLTIGTEAKPSAEAELFQEAQARLPRETPPGTVTAQWAQSTGANKRALIIEWMTAALEPDFFPYASDLVIVEGKTEILSRTADKVTLRKTVEKLGAAWPDQMAGLLVRKEGEANEGFEVSVPIEKGSAPLNGSTASAKSLWQMLLYAFLGGLILNIMPCVLPVIALKILGFVNQSREQPRQVRVLGLLYTLGVIASFLVLAGFVIGIKAAGQKAGWGMQFSNPQFIVVLAIIITLVALNLFGVFEITLSGRAMNAASGAAARQGTTGAFLNGVLATILATPCTAPFLGVSLGFAFAQPASIIVLFFTTIALGLALPYLVLSWSPRLMKFLPKPGPWMERFKVAMGFPLAATALWLVTLTVPHYGDRFWWLGLFLVIVALAAWVFGEFVQRGTKRRGLAVMMILVLLAGGFFYAIESQLQWRRPIEVSASEGSLQGAPAGYAWQRWTPETLAAARTEGRPIIVDFTAKWCVTCNTVVKPALEMPSVLAKLTEVNAIALLGDYTRFPPEISAELEKYERAGVPLVLVFPKDASQPAIILPDVLLPGVMANNVIAALDEAVR